MNLDTTTFHHKWESGHLMEAGVRSFLDFFYPFFIKKKRVINIGSAGSDRRSDVAPEGVPRGNVLETN